MSEVIVVVLSFARASAAGDPYAFRLGHQEYILVGAGGGTSEATLSWDDALLADLSAIRRPNHDPAIVQRLGEKLREFLSPAGWPQHEARILDAVHAQRKLVLIVRSSAAEIYALPWELLTLKVTGQQVGELPNVLLCYEWPETVSTHTTEPSKKARTDGRVLMAWSAAGGAVPVAEHGAAIQRACQAAGHKFDLEQDILQHASLRRLAEALEAAQKQERPVTVLHLLCHGQAAGGSFGLALDGNEAGETAVVDAAGLRRVLAPHSGMVQLVVLSACDSGNSGDLGNRLGSLAQALHRIGIAKVVASRYPLSVTSSISLAEVLYRALATEHGSVEAALLEVRQELFKDHAHLDWASLQLYARGADGFFQPTALARRPALPAPAAAQESSPPQQQSAPSHGALRWVALIALGIAVLAVGVRLVQKNFRPVVAQTQTAPLPNPIPATVPATVPPATVTATPTTTTPTTTTPTTTTPTTTTPSIEAAPPKKPTPTAPKKPPVARVESAPMFSVRIRSEAGNVIRVGSKSGTAQRALQRNQAEASFQLPAGTHRVSCTDSVSKQSTDVSVRVGDGEKNEADCFPP